MGTSMSSLFQISAKNETETGSMASEIAKVMSPGDIIALDGTLGAGKTAFARAFINSLPGEIEEVPSPTFTLVQTYHRGDVEVWHFDLYRLEAADDAIELGIEDAFAEAISLIEWPDKLGPYLPSRHLRIRLIHQGGTDNRVIELFGNKSWEHRLKSLSGVGEAGV